MKNDKFRLLMSSWSTRMSLHCFARCIHHATLNRLHRWRSAWQQRWAWSRLSERTSIAGAHVEVQWAARSIVKREQTGWWCVINASLFRSMHTIYTRLCHSLDDQTIRASARTQKKTKVTNHRWARLPLFSPLQTKGFFSLLFVRSPLSLSLHTHIYIQTYTSTHTSYLLSSNDILRFSLQVWLEMAPHVWNRRRKSWRKIQRKSNWRNSNRCFPLWNRNQRRHRLKSFSKRFATSGNWKINWSIDFRWMHWIHPHLLRRHIQVCRPSIDLSFLNQSDLLVSFVTRPSLADPTLLRDIGNTDWLAVEHSSSVSIYSVYILLYRAMFCFCFLWPHWTRKRSMIASTRVMKWKKDCSKQNGHDRSMIVSLLETLLRLHHDEHLIFDH